jgi:acetyl esterase
MPRTCNSLAACAREEKIASRFFRVIACAPVSSTAMSNPPSPFAGLVLFAFGLSAFAADPATPATPAAKPKATPVYTAQISAGLKPSSQAIYKTIEGRELHLHIFKPEGWAATDKRPCFFSIHGGGWTSGSPASMYAFVKHCTDLGMVGLSVEYRLYKAKSPVTVFHCVQDVRSAMRYVHSHATELGIDPAKIVVNGSSAGGHLAAATALFPEVNEPGEDTSIPCAPAALMLFSPVIDCSPQGYGNAKIGERWQELSPAHRVVKGLPPTIVFHGTADTTTPYAGAKLFHEEMQRAGNRCELVTMEGGIHTYMFKDAARYTETLQKMDAFFASVGIVRQAAR